MDWHLNMNIYLVCCWKNSKTTKNLGVGSWKPPLVNTPIITNAGPWAQPWILLGWSWKSITTTSSGGPLDKPKVQFVSAASAHMHRYRRAAFKFIQATQSNWRPSDPLTPSHPSRYQKLEAAVFVSDIFHRTQPVFASDGTLRFFLFVFLNGDIKQNAASTESCEVLRCYTLGLFHLVLKSVHRCGIYMMYIRQSSSMH